MKIYISGKLTGTEQNVFNDVESFLTDIGYEAVNPIKIINSKLPDKKKFGKRMELLYDCDAIYLIDDWKSSTHSRTEYFVAKNEGKYIFHENNSDEDCSKESIEKELEQQNIERKTWNVKKIQNAIFQVTGMKFKEYVTDSRQRDGFYARMIFVYHCKRCRQYQFNITDIAKLIHRNHSSILHILNKYQDEMKYNPSFRYIATKVNKILNDNNETQI